MPEKTSPVSRIGPENCEADKVSELEARNRDDPSVPVKTSTVKERSTPVTLQPVLDFLT